MSAGRGHGQLVAFGMYGCAGFGPTGILYPSCAGRDRARHQIDPQDDKDRQHDRRPDPARVNFTPNAACHDFSLLNRCARGPRTHIADAQSVVIPVVERLELVMDGGPLYFEWPSANVPLMPPVWRGVP